MLLCILLNMLTLIYQISLAKKRDRRISERVISSRRQVSRNTQRKASIHIS